jgi:hypothetical protein
MSINKYLKYKQKYLNLRAKMIGGKFELNLNDWYKISNSGQHNCGVFLSDKYPKYITKCETNDSNKLILVNEINSHIDLFPEIIYDKQIDDYHYITMKKLDGDITNLYFDLFPKIVLNEMQITETQKRNLLFLFKSKISYTRFNPDDIRMNLTEFDLYCISDANFLNEYKNYLTKHPEIIRKITDITINGKLFTDINIKPITEIDRYINNIKKINNLSDITLSLYDEFIYRLTKVWKKYHGEITSEIIKINMLLLNLGYRYGDNKFDNYGYILSSVPLNDFRKYNTPKILNKYLYVYFLDWESGLSKVNIGDYKYKCNDIIYNINTGVNYTVNGQYRFNNINENKLIINSNLNLELLGIKNEMIMILQKEYYFDLDDFRHNFTTISEVEKYIFGEDIINRPNFKSLQIFCDLIKSDNDKSGYTSD